MKQFTHCTALFSPCPSTHKDSFRYSRPNHWGMLCYVQFPWNNDWTYCRSFDPRSNIPITKETTIRLINLYSIYASISGLTATCLCSTRASAWFSWASRSHLFESLSDGSIATLDLSGPITFIFGCGPLETNGTDFDVSRSIFTVPELIAWRLFQGVTFVFAT